MEGGPSSLRGSSLSQRSSWIAETFVDATEAITSLCVDHSGFVAREDIMQSIPPRIKALITHPSTMMQIEGFEKLFFHLDTSPGPQILRRFIVAYFNDNPQLRPCLRQAPLLTPASESIPSLQAGPSYTHGAPNSPRHKQQARAGTQRSPYRSSSGRTELEPHTGVRKRKGCLTCRIRRKVCSDTMFDVKPKRPCSICRRLQIECLGYFEKRPRWMKDLTSDVVRTMRADMKGFLLRRVTQSSNKGFFSFSEYYKRDNSFIPPFPVEGPLALYTTPLLDDDANEEGDSNAPSYHSDDETSHAVAADSPSTPPFSLFPVDGLLSFPQSKPPPPQWPPGFSSSLLSFSDNEQVQASSQVEPHFPLPVVLRGHSSSVLSIACSPCASKLASASDDFTVQLWDTQTGARMVTLIGHSSPVKSVLFSANGSRLASKSDDGVVCLWDSKGVRLATLGDAFNSLRSSRSLAFSADGSRLASGSDAGEIRLWDGGTGALVATLKGHSRAVSSVVFSVNGARIVSAYEDGTVWLWDGQTGSLLVSIESGSAPLVIFSPDGSTLASMSRDGTARMWDGKTGAKITTLESRDPSEFLSPRLHKVTGGIAFSADGLRLASVTGGPSIYLWDSKTFDLVATLDGHSRPVNSLSFSPDSSRLASASDDNTARLWDGKTGAHIMTLTGHSDSINCVAFSADGLILASASDDSTVRLWDGKAGTHAATTSYQPILDLTGHQPNPVSESVLSVRSLRAIHFEVPSITRIIPNSGSVTGGTEIALFGTRFLPWSRCVFGSEEALATYQDESSLICVLPPARKPGLVPVALKTGLEADQNEVLFFTYQDDLYKELAILLKTIAQGRSESRSSLVTTPHQPPPASRHLLTVSSSKQGIGPVTLSTLGSSTVDLQRVVTDFLKLLDDEEQQDSVSVVEMLSCTSKSNRTLLHLSAALGFYELLSGLIAHGVDLNRRDIRGYTALHYAALYSHPACARLLVDSGAKLDILDIWGRLAHELVVEGSAHSDFQEILREKAASMSP